MKKQQTKILLITAVLIWSYEAASQTQRTSSYEYNFLGQVISIDGPRSDITDSVSLSYNASGELALITNALGHTNQYSQYDGNGNLLSATDANGLTTQFAYDSLNRLTSVTQAFGTALASTTQLDYDDFGNLTQIVDALDRSTTFVYDDANRLIQITDENNNRIEFSLDVAGNLVGESVYDASGSLIRTYSQAFDELNRQIGITGASLQTEAYSYDVNGNQIGRIDGNLNHTATSYDGLNREVQSTDPFLNSALVTYNELDQITSLTDEKGLVTSYSYNGFGDLVAINSPDTGVSQLGYDEAGNLVSKIDANGVTTNYEYDALNRPTNVNFSGDATLNIQYEYDAGSNGVGQLTGFVDNSGQTDYSYDELGRLVTESYQVDSRSFSKTYGYNLAGELIAIQYPSGTLVSYTRDNLGNISQVAISDTPSGNTQVLVSGASYLPFGGLTAMTYGNGLALNRTFDQDYRLTNQSVSGGAQYQENSYQYDANSNITQIADLDNVQSTQDFSYDSLNRVTLEDSDYGEKIYQYDAVGNRTKRTFNKPDGTTGNQNSTYGVDSNRLTFLGNKPFNYDGNGNAVELDNKDGTPREVWAYDQRNRMVAYWKGSVMKATYNYNALGQRVLKVRYDLDETEMLEEGNTFVFHYDQAGQLIQESRYNPNGLLKRERQYIWLEAMPIAYLETVYRNNGEVKTEYLSYITPDHLNTPRFATNDNQQIVWSWYTDAFGIGSNERDPDGDGVSVNIRLRFPGQYEDGESGNHYNYFRDYDPTTGRYIQSDPIGLGGGLNTYGYVGGNPLSYVDPLGLARFGFRPLGGDEPYYNSHNTPDGSSNHHRAHEQLWFDDNPNENVGFFAGDGNGSGPAICGEDGDIRSDNGYNRNDYDFFGPVYDDNLMRQALDNIRGDWDNNTYCVAGRNCQHFSDALRQEYDRLANSPTCRMTRRGMRCN